MTIEVTWDESKRRANLDKHGLDFADLALEFFLSSMVVPAKEGQFVAVGPSKHGMITVVFAKLGMQGVAIISMRPASRKERMAHAEDI